MKKIFLLFLFLVISITGFSQWLPPLAVPDSITPFGTFRPAGSLILNRQDLKYWELTTNASTVTTLQTPNKTLFGYATILWDSTGFHLTPKDNRYPVNSDSTYEIDGARVLYQRTANSNLFVGYQSGLTTTGANNTGVGIQSLYQNISGADNTAVGQGALGNNNSGDGNCAVGMHSMENHLGGDYNTAIGYAALQYNPYFSNTTALGDFAGYYRKGNNCLYLGHYAGQYSNGYPTPDSTDNMIYIGVHAYGSYKEQQNLTPIIIKASATDSSATIGTFNFPPTIGGFYTLPFSDGSVGEVLSTDGSGNVTWQPSGGGSGFDSTHLYHYILADTLRLDTIYPVAITADTGTIYFSLTDTAGNTGGVIHCIVKMDSLCNGFYPGIWQKVPSGASGSFEINADSAGTITQYITGKFNSLGNVTHVSDSSAKVHINSSDEFYLNIYGSGGKLTIDNKLAAGLTSTQSMCGGAFFYFLSKSKREVSITITYINHP